MKRNLFKLSTALFLATFCSLSILVPLNAEITFGPNVRVDDAGTSVSNQIYPSMAVDTNGNVYVAWEDRRDFMDVYFTKSINGGTSFSPHVQVDDSSINGQGAPSIAVDINGNIYVAWEDGRNDNTDIYFTKSINGGTSFGANVRVDNTGSSTTYQGEPSIATDSSGNIYVVWCDERNGSGKYSIYFAKSTNGGTSFPANVRVDDAGSSATRRFNPNVTVDHNGNIYVVWEDFRNGDDIYFAKSSDGGASFGPNIRVNDSNSVGKPNKYPSIAVDNNGNIYIVWCSERDVYYDIYFAKSSDGGASFGQNVRVDDTGTVHSPQYLPSIAIGIDGNIYVTWKDKRNGNVDIYFSRSTDRGVSFESNVKVSSVSSSQSTLEGAPAIAVDKNGNIYVAWDDYRNGNYDIYFSKAEGTGAAVIKLEFLSLQNAYPYADISTIEFNYTFSISPTGDSTTIETYTVTDPLIKDSDNLYSLMFSNCSITKKLHEKNWLWVNEIKDSKIIVRNNLGNKIAEWNLDFTFSGNWDSQLYMPGWKPSEQLCYIDNQLIQNSVELNQGLHMFFTLRKGSGTSAYPLILVHGRKGGEGDWGEVDNRLAGFHQVWEFSYPPTQWFDINNSAGLLGKAINYILSATGKSKVNVVGYSQGGLVSRCYFENSLANFNKLNRLIMLATPNYGSAYANSYYYNEDANKKWIEWSGNNDHDLSVGSRLAIDVLHNVHPSIRNMLKDKYLVIAGTNEILRSGPPPWAVILYTQWWETEANDDSDGIVSVSSASLKNFGVPLMALNLNHFQSHGGDDITESELAELINIINNFLINAEKNETTVSYEGNLIVKGSNITLLEDEILTIEKGNFIHYLLPSLDEHYYHYFYYEDNFNDLVDNHLRPENIEGLEEFLKKFNAYVKDIRSLITYPFTREERMISLPEGLYSLRKRNVNNWQNYTEIGAVYIQSSQTTIWSNSPETPVPISPQDEAQINNLTPTFEWSLFQDGGDGDTQVGYQLRVRDDDGVSWDFSTPTNWGTLPPGWQDDSSAGSSHTYRVTTFDGKNSLQIKTTGGTWDRVKTRTTSTYKAGIYEWKVYVPSINEPGASSSIGVFLYSPQSSGDTNAREVDFEIGYGTAEQRIQYAISDGKLMCYMTVQRDDSSGTQHSTHAIAIDPGNWYTLRTILDVNDQNSYVVSWWLKKDGESEFWQGRSNYTCQYGVDDTTFYIETSVENFENKWIGDFQPTVDKEAYFDYISVKDTIVYDTGFISDTSGHTHTYTPNAIGYLVSEPLQWDKHYHWHVRYQDSDGEWSSWSKDTPGDHQDFYTSMSSQHIEYQTDFSSNPNWDTNDPTNYHWDSQTQTFYTNNYTNSGKYATIPIQYDGNSFQLEFDIKPTTRDTGDVCVGLFGNSRESHQRNSESVFVLLGGYAPGALYLEGKSATGQSIASTPSEISLQTDKWYHFVIEYDFSINKINFVATREGTTLISWTGDVTGGFSSNLTNLGVSMNGTWVTSGRWETAYIDNIKFITAPSLPNNPPNKPNNVSPANGAIDVSLTPTLQASVFSDSDSGDIHQASQWQISSSSGNYSSPIWGSGIDTTNKTSVTVPSGKLGYSSTYYWHVRYQDNHGAWSEYSDETSFTTEPPPPPPNDPPFQPNVPTGPSNGYVNTSYNFSTSTTDPNGDKVAYRFDWGDGNISDWTAFVASGTTINASHSYSEGNKSYGVKVQAKDEHDLIQNQWSDTFWIYIYPPSFEFNPAPSPASQSIVQGESASYAISLKSLGGYNSPVYLSVSNISPWPGSSNAIACNFSQSPITPQDPSATSTLNVTTLQNVFPGTYTIQIQAQDGTNIKYTSVTLIVNPSSLNGSISGRVYEEETGNLLDGVVVQAKEQFGNWWDRNSDTTEAGIYKIDGLVTGPYSIYARRSGYGTALKTDIPVNSGQETSNQDLYMSNNPGWIYGTVKDSNNTPLENTWVEVQIKSGYRAFWINTYDYTDNTGYFELRDLNPGNNYTIRTGGFSKDGKNYASMEVSGVSVNKGQGTEVNFVVQEAAKIFGKVTDSLNNPIKDVKINCWRQPEGWGVPTIFTDSNGNYEFRYLLPGYDYTLDFDPPDSTDYVVKRFNLNVPTSGNYEQNVTLDSGAIQISGKVTEASTSNPLGNIRITYWHESLRVGADTRTNSDGDYLLANLPKGEAQLRAEPEHTYAQKGIEQDFQTSTTINVALVPESTLSGIVRDALTKEPLGNIRVSYSNDSQGAQKEMWTDSNGQFNFTGLPEGIAKLSVRSSVSSGYAWERKYIYLNQGENKANIDFMLKQGFLVSGYVRNTSGVSIPNIEVKAENMLSMCWVVTDSSGYYEVRLPTGTYGIYVDNDYNDQYVALPKVLTITANTSNVDFTAYDNTTGATITGNINNNGSYSVTSGFGVTALPAGTTIDIDSFDIIGWINSASVSPNGGVYSLLVPPGQNYDIYFFTQNKTVDGIESVTVRGSLLNVPPGSTGQNFTYTSVGGVITGTANYYGNGEAVLLSTVCLMDSLGNFAGIGETDQNGTYTIYNVPAGNYTIQAKHPEYGKSQVYAVSGVTDEGVESRYIEFVTPIIVTGDLDNNGQDEVIIDFGEDYGIWIYYNNSNWTQLHNISPQFMVVGDLDTDPRDDLIIDFGNPYGIWIYYNNSTWTQLHGITPEVMETSDLDGNGKDDIIIDFGNPYGIWIYYNNSTWTQLHSITPESMVVGSLDADLKDEIIIDFGPPYGIWIYYNNSTWTQLHNLSPESITATKDVYPYSVLVVDFGEEYGIWVYDSTETWEQLHNISPDAIVTGDINNNGHDEGIIDFGSEYGVWKYYPPPTDSWAQLHNLSPEYMVTGNLDGTDGDDIVIDFGDPYGIWVYYNNSTWTKLHDLSP